MTKERDMNIVGVVYDPGIGMIDRKVMRDRNLSIYTKAVYSYLASLVGIDSTEYPSPETIGEELGISVQVLELHIKELRKLGLLASLIEGEV